MENNNSLTIIKKADPKTKSNGEAFQIAFDSMDKIKTMLTQQNDKEKLVLKKLMIEMSINNSLLNELLTSFSTRVNIIDVEIIVLESQISTIERLTLENKKEIQSNDQEKIKEISSMIDKLIDPLLKNIDGLTNKFTEKNVNDEELKKKIDVFFENSKKLFQGIDKAEKSQFLTKFSSLFGVISGFLGIGSVTAIGATEAVGVTSLIAVGATSLSVVAPICAPVLLTFGCLVGAFISFYKQSVARDKKLKTLKSLLSYYMENIELISQVTDETTKLIYHELKEKVLEFKKLEANLKIDFDLSPIKDQFKSITSKQNLIKDKVEEIANYQLDLIQECQKLKKKSLKNKTINKK
ncbi:hypothetical protein DDB_G0272716 [Dictyostelium discoideum AX4]|uniref:Transmembrane protein DDB_G0272716 n=1 Tax=Dictyostelium discoideum TaxID=44689 RepID=Y2716_DICDI|nr:hypothetical protein DDB_G0272716 [Dictyostelium discoideum AX4]Q86IJ0.1 RecName: Full=Transmembrane protein DDB_G0272716 [Dictyostelium discoideum]EAL70995.1 hypothetical protein DDB_G0272716 [Dictyostelium discoideum AX4]|eukprot:XP_644865.1 hypothetical protein DDB_G0272716 [Dictyostelium discoideum AX4]